MKYVFQLARELDTAKKTASSVVIPIIPDNKEELEKLKAVSTVGPLPFALQDQREFKKNSIFTARFMFQQIVYCSS